MTGDRDAIAQEVAQLRDLFQRRLLDDRAKNDLIRSVQQDLAARTALETGAAHRDLFLELVTALDRLDDDAAGIGASVKDEILTILARRGLAPVLSTGPYDPQVHEVTRVVAPTSDVVAGSIVAVERGGYTLGNRLLRPARVVICAEPRSPR